MTIQLIINELKREGVNSKQRVIDKLENLTLEELRTLKRDINERICKEKGEGNAI
ncbi:MAG TPA: hypothetical protein PLS84_09440 [Salinivirgaceae bacterium]|jgi:hypothetical protein|nr:hypothetical protein [Salinivirgaceae bacterium]